MIGYTLPLDRYPDTYNGQPLCYAGLAAQKNHLSLYLTGAYADPAVEKRLRDGFAKAGKKLVVAKAVAAIPPAAFIKRYEAARSKKK
jgi:hypothetical protein